MTATPSSSLVAVIGVAAVVLVFAAVLSMANGFERTMVSAGAEDTAVILRSGSTSEMSSGPEMLFIAGILLVSGAVLVIMYNTDLLLRLILLVVGRSPRFAPVLRMAIAYPLSSRFRTGMTIAIFAVITFSVIFMATLFKVNDIVLADTEQFTGGFDLRVTVQGFFNMAGKNRKPLVFDQVAFTVKKIKITFLIHTDQVAGSQPAVFRQHFGRRFGPVPVLDHDVLAFHPHLSRFARGALSTVLSDDFHFGEVEGTTG